MTDSLQNTDMLATVEVEVKTETTAKLKTETTDKVKLELTLEEKKQRCKQRYLDLIERCRSGEYKTRAERNATRSIRVVPEKAPEITPEETKAAKATRLNAMNRKYRALHREEYDAFMRGIMGEK